MPAGGMILRATSLLELNLYVLPLYIGWLIITIIIITIIINFDLWFISFASFSGRDAATAWASYCGPVPYSLRIVYGFFNTPQLFLRQDLWEETSGL